MLESLKLIVRLAVLSFVGFVLAPGVIDFFLVLLGGNSLSPDVKTALQAALTTFFIGLDKYIHENEDIKLKGIVPF